jgi:hypothetical protein
MNALADMPSDFKDGLRVPPHSTELEQEILGALLIDNDCYAASISGVVSDADFYGHDHRLIFSTIVGMLESRKPADVITVFEALQRVGKHVDAGGLDYLNRLANCVTGSRNTARHVEIVRERALERALIIAADKAAALAWQPGAVSEKLDTIAASFALLERGRMRNAPRSMDDLVVDAIDRLTAAAEGRAVEVWATGIAPLDRFLGRRPAPGQGVRHCGEAERGQVVGSPSDRHQRRQAWRAGAAAVPGNAMRRSDGLRAGSTRWNRQRTHANSKAEPGRFRATR